MNIIEQLKAKIESMISDTNNDTSVGAIESLIISKTLHNVLSILSDIEKEEKSRRVLTLEEEFDGYNPIVVTLDKYVLEGIGIGRYDKVIINIQRNE